MRISCSSKLNKINKINKTFKIVLKISNTSCNVDYKVFNWGKGFAHLVQELSNDHVSITFVNSYNLLFDLKYRLCNFAGNQIIINDTNVYF